jgi:hypothetical protein
LYHETDEIAHHVDYEELSDEDEDFISTNK